MAAKGVTEKGQSSDGPVWNVVGHTYTPKFVSENAFIWHGILPADTFVPPHIHTTQDEWICVLRGELEIEFDGEPPVKAAAGDTVRMPQSGQHGIFNRSGAEAEVMFGAAPTGKLYDLFVNLDRVTDPAELVRISAEHDVVFPPPPGA
ncbi:MAG: cupin domain-containing protein [Pseudomonadota bacterium]